MSNIYSLKLIKNGVTVQRKQIATGIGKGVAPLTLTAAADLTYVLQDESGAKPVIKIKTRLVGEDLYVAVSYTHLTLPTKA
mgnify:CR=1 FL=1